ncbi:hypothetical protein N7466_010743 [Penicillium verhagenii]|uniref:uncharacterized protein n=1 Tax=Penicillium verhagenii TaxID=1562060 RepID=UPI00254595B0|nr:uncharacterized protein N7466_010743 [Penicillium verhagenii]KAJ5917189.1 hypothetical protein N7466_010743 [Penicillium verhagenii]
MHECASCDEVFDYYDDLEEHMEDCGHWFECDTCTKTFRSQRACNQHMDALDHHLIECETCTREFGSQDAANQYMNDKDHWETYCVPCGRHFMNANNLHMHRNSRVHRGTNSHCPHCNAAFVTSSGVNHHLETGSCPNAPNMNRESILRILQQSDRRGLITNKQISWHNNEESEKCVPSHAFNGSGWECYICHREFRTCQSLTQHLNSPIHAQKVYHCPNGSCGKEFVSLAGLFAHFESESCGFMRFERVQQVQRTLNNAIMGRRQITAI